MRNFDTKKEQILDAALKVAVQKGIANVTVRDVAKEAGVNIAAINYYFSSKKRMLEEMEVLFRDNFREAFTALDVEGLPAEEKLLSWMSGALEYAVHYPGIILLLRDKLLLNVDEPQNAAMRFELVRRIIQVKMLFNEAVGAPDGDDKLFTMFASTVLWPFVVSPLIFGEVDSYAEKQSRDDYFRYIINFFKTKSSDDDAQ